VAKKDQPLTDIADAKQEQHPLSVSNKGGSTSVKTIGQHSPLNMKQHGSFLSEYQRVLSEQDIVWQMTSRKSGIIYTYINGSLHFIHLHSRQQAPR